MMTQSLGGMEGIVGMSLLTGGLVLDKSELFQGSKLSIDYLFAITSYASFQQYLSCWARYQHHQPVRATLPRALNTMNASSVGKLVQLVTTSRLILYHEGRVDPMKDECHYQIKH